tara:strand:- start:124 stop:627 length:504 start_codon:yes stop_codon:yes gene_type:complete
MTNKGKKYLTKITPKQQKFIDLYTSKYGELTAGECAARAGYDKGSSHTRAHELLDWRQYPQVVAEIEARQVDNRSVWLVDKEKHLANLHRIQQEAKSKGQYGVAGKMEELKGKVQGFYVDRNLNITKEVSSEDLNEKMKSIFSSREEMEIFNKSLADELFTDDKKED